MTDYLDKGTVAGLVHDLRHSLVALDATTAALEDYSDAGRLPIKTLGETHPDADLFARCREWRGFADSLNVPDRGDIIDEEQDRYRSLFAKVQDVSAKTPEGLAFKMQTTLRRYYGCVIPDGTLEDFVVELERIAGRSRP